MNRMSDSVLAKVLVVTLVAIAGDPIADIGELERVTKRGGLVIIATAAPGDVSQVDAEPLGNNIYRSRVRGQEGCVLLIPDRQAIGALLPGRQIQLGEFGFRFPGTVARFWIIVYRMP